MEYFKNKILSVGSGLISNVIYGMNHFFLSFSFQDIKDVWMKWKFVRTEGSDEGPQATKFHEASRSSWRIKMV